MPTFFDRKLSPLTAGIFLAAAALISGDQAALAANVRFVSSAASTQQGSENLLLARIGQPPQPTTSPSPNPGTVRRGPLPARIPEPSTVVGLGLVAGSLAVTRRGRLKN